ncbi:MAG: SBBP repeat-containing protein [Candidatus Acidiferrales bacterium]
MQTKSPLAGIAIYIAVATVLLSLFIFTTIHYSNHASQENAVRHSRAAESSSAATSAAAKQDFAKAYGKLPLAFEENQGQTSPQVRFLSRGGGYELFLTSQEVVLGLRQPMSTRTARRDRAVRLRVDGKTSEVEKVGYLRMRLKGANQTLEIAGAGRLPGRVNYFIGNDPKKWQIDVPAYSEVRYHGVYPGVDLVFYGNQRVLEYDFIVAPGADPELIALDVEGAQKLQINSKGNVAMRVGAGEVELQKPAVYQEKDGERREIAGNYLITNDHEVRFSIAGYDHTRPLTIDPVLTYSTYIGGEALDFATGIALDAAGDAYIAGSTTSTKFPSMNPVSPTAPLDLSLGTAFVSELNPAGTALLYSTYLGGSGNTVLGEGANAIAVDGSGNIYVTGFTGSSDFPLSTSPFQSTPPASVTSAGAAFVTKLAPSASGLAQLAYSSYLGGNVLDSGQGIAVDGSGNAFVVGVTQSSNFPTQGTQIIPGPTNPAGNAFLTKINTTASGTASLVYSTLLGGTSAASSFVGFGDIAFAVALNGADAYVVGGTSATNFPTTGTAIVGSAGCGANNGSGSGGSAFISVIDTTAQALTYSHCLSGNAAEVALGVNLGPGVPAAANATIAYITGVTDSSNFPVTPNSIPPAGTVTFGVAFVSLVDTSSGTLQYSTFLGGTGGDDGFAIGSDSQGNAYVTGITNSTDFPITQGALIETNSNPTYGVAFVTKVSPNGQGAADLVYSTFFGGQTANSLSTPDLGQGIAVAGTNAYITGEMSSPDMPVTSGVFQSALGATGAVNAFVAQLPMVPTISVSPTSLAFGIQLVGKPSQAQFVTLTNNTSSSIGLTLPATIVGPNAADFSGVAGGANPCGASLAGGASCTVAVTFTPSSVGGRSVAMNIPDTADTAAHPISVALTGTGSGTASNITITPTSLTFPGTLLTQTSTPMMVSIGNNGNLPLSISAISTGTGVFAETSNTAACNNGAFPIVIAPNGAPCAINVTFAPTASTTPGPVAGALTITQTGGSVGTVPLSGTAWDFSVSAGSASVAKGAMGTFPVTITGLGGFTGMVSFMCTPGSTLVTACAVPTTSAAPAPGVMVNGTLTAASFIVAPESIKVPPAATLQQLLLVMLAIGLLFMIPSTRRFRTRLGMAGAMLVFIMVAGCTGSSPKPKTTTLTVTPSSGGVTKPAITVNVTIT